MTVTKARSILLFLSVFLAASGTPSYVALAEGDAPRSNYLQATRQISLDASPSVVDYGEPVVLRGQIESDDESCRAYVLVNIDVDPANDSRSRHHIGETRSSESGEFEETVIPTNSGTFTALISEDQDSACPSAESDESTVHVRLGVTLKPNVRRVEEGSLVRLHVTVSPDCRGLGEDKIDLYQFKNGAYKKVAEQNPSGNCSTTFRRRVVADISFQARKGPQRSAAEDYRAGRSPEKAVGVK